MLIRPHLALLLFALVGCAGELEVGNARLADSGTPEASVGATSDASFDAQVELDAGLALDAEVVVGADSASIPSSAGPDPEKEFLITAAHALSGEWVTLPFLSGQSLTLTFVPTRGEPGGTYKFGSSANRDASTGSAPMLLPARNPDEQGHYTLLGVQDGELRGVLYDDHGGYFGLLIDLATIARGFNTIRVELGVAAITGYATLERRVP